MSCVIYMACVLCYYVAVGIVDDRSLCPGEDGRNQGRTKVSEGTSHFIVLLTLSKRNNGCKKVDCLQ